ncbi:MAG: right-handed parallel beta-helix repeat-containing protein [Myxococcales bacterium]|nr:right-handed parallel beta-helix repeat-containing protein [Myxococcales bacterium]
MVVAQNTRRRRLRGWGALWGAWALGLGSVAGADTLAVPADFGTVQAALDAAIGGDRIEVAPGVYPGDVDFLGKDVRVVGAGLETILQGTGTGSVVSFVSGETPAAVLDSVVVTGGSAVQGGGIEITDSSPTIVRSFISVNESSQGGSGITVRGATAAPWIYNNVLAHNTHTAGDPHGLEVDGASPLVVNNTIVRGDSNGVILRGSAGAVLRGNVIARNGSRVGGKLRGRGICDFSGGGAVIAHNVFHRNRIAALLRGGKDWRKVKRLQKRMPEDTQVFGNSDGKPGFVRNPKRNPARSDLADLALRDSRRAKAVDAGDPDPACNDLDGTRNDAGHGGGPYAAPSTALPGPGSCGA